MGKVETFDGSTLWLFKKGGDGETGTGKVVDWKWIGKVNWRWRNKKIICIALLALATEINEIDFFFLGR